MMRLMKWIADEDAACTQGRLELGMVRDGKDVVNAVPVPVPVDEVSAAISAVGLGIAAAVVAPSSGASMAMETSFAGCVQIAVRWDTAAHRNS